MYIYIYVCIYIYTKSVITSKYCLKKLLHQPERLGQLIVVPILTIIEWRRRVKSLEALEFIQIYGCQNPKISSSHSDSRLYWLISGIFPLYGWQITLALRFCTRNPLGSHHFCLWNIHSWSFLGYAPFPDPIWIQSLAYRPGPPAWHSDLLGNPRVAGYPPHPAIHSMGPMCEIITWVKWSGYQGSMGCKWWSWLITCHSYCCYYDP